jgi:phthiocerol/phenolphthiocerol synthesis type-I polyketide synthase E
MIEQPTAIDRALADVWQQVLRRPKVEPADDFFDLGGSSIQATQIVARVRDLFDVELPVSVLERTPTFGDFVGVVSTAVHARRE